ncbi:MAG: hypothetical protein GWP91_25355, partial [Rhodobacterales bacterium]|nr:hypothetical protein [Rhodobacterales bacterium]
AAGHGTNAYLAKYDLTGALVWSSELDAGLLDGNDLLTSNDSYTDVAVDSLDDICVGGTTAVNIAGRTTESYAQTFLTEKRSGVDGSLVWEDRFQDSTGSHVQYNNTVAIDSADLYYAAGWSYRAAFIAGQWDSFRYLNNTGARDLGPIQYDYDDSVRPDVAHGIATDSVGNYYVVGVNANTDANGGGLDWQVNKYDSSGLLLWSDSYAGIAGLDDAAKGVTVNNLDQAIVVGYTNTGTDDEDNAAKQWLMIKYDELGLDGNGVRTWEATWESAVGANEHATDITIDSFGDPIVVGTWRDGTHQAWRAAAISGLTGDTTSDWRWSNTGADTEPLSVSIYDETVAIVGYQWNGVNNDLLLAILDQDNDGDLVGNSLDGCPDDGAKTEPGECGCGVEDIDTDGDTFLDCNDACPDLIEKFEDDGICGCDEADIDRDGDGTMDCVDNCPDNPDKIALGVCGCGGPDDDSDGDGILGCDDACSNTPAGTEVDSAGCPLIDDPTGDGIIGDDDKDSSGCSTAPLNTGFLAIGLAALMIRRRR